MKIKAIKNKEIIELCIMYSEKDWNKKNKKQKLSFIKGYKKIEKKHIKEVKKCGSFQNWYLRSNRTIVVK